MRDRGLAPGTLHVLAATGEEGDFGNGGDPGRRGRRVRDRGLAPGTLHELAATDEEGDFGNVGDYSPESLPSGTVAEWMSEDVVSVEPGHSLRAACKKMRDRRNHRVLVIEDG